jgi:hypothetical protein
VSPPLTPYILVVTKCRDDVFGALFFAGLPDHLRSRIRIREFGTEPLTAALAGAAAVIVMRHGLFSFGHVAAAAGWARVPRYYFLDDNLMLLSEEPEVYGSYWSAYTHENVRRALKGFEGVLLASRPLMQYFEEHRLHHALIEYPPIAWPVLRRRTAWSREPGQPFRIAFFGGEHRRELFTSLVYPAAERLALSKPVRPVELVVAGIEPGAFGLSTTEDTEDTEEQSFSPSRLNLRVPRVLRGGESSATALPQLRVVHLPYDVRYGAALERLAGHRIDVLAHPTPPSRNNPYRNANVLINARSVGAVPVVSRVPPYDALESPGPAVLCENEVDAWHSALARLAADPQACDEVFRRTSAFCDAHFSGRLNVDAISRLLETHAAPRPLTRVARALIAGPRLGLDRAVVRTKDLARRSALVRTAAGRLRHRTV